MHGIIPVVLLNGGKPVILTADDILQGKRIAVAVGLECVGQGQLARALALLAEVHEQLVLNALGSICRQPYVLIRPEGADGLDQTDRADRNQIVLLRAGSVVFF